MEDLTQIAKELAELPGQVPPERWSSDDPLIQAFKRLLEITLVLHKEVVELRERLGENSQNSSKPPSSDPPGTQRKPDRGPSTRKQGGQKGRKGVHRSLLPISQVDEVVSLRPKTCSCCSASLEGSTSIRFSRHQVSEIPPVKAKTTEYQQHSVRCDNCKSTTKAALPDGVPSGRFGPALVGLVAILLGKFKMSCRSTQELLAMLGLKIGLGTIPQLQQLASQALKAPWLEVRARAPKAKVINADDTAWRLNKAYLSVVCLVAPAWTLYQIVAKRDHKTLKQIFKGFTGLLGCDRASTYSFYKGLRQACLAHVDRLFQRFIDRGGQSRAVGKPCQTEFDRMWAAWHDLCSGEIDRARFRERIWPIRARIARHLKIGENCNNPKTARSCSRLLRRFGELWTFVSNPDIEPTNNSAERALRTLVMLRRVCFGSKTEKGVRFVERVLTVVETARKTGQDVWGFVADCVKANLSGRRGPRLLLAA